MSPDIRMAFEDDGSITIDASGFKGKACLKKVEQLVRQMKALGVTVNVESTVLKEEYHLSEVSQVKQREHEQEEV